MIRFRIPYAGMTRIRFVGYVSQPRGTPSGFIASISPARGKFKFRAAQGKTIRAQ